MPYPLGYGGYCINFHYLSQFYTYSNNLLHLGNLDPEFVYHRRRGLERFLNRCACHPVFAYSKVFHDFLTRKDEKVEHSVFCTCLS